MTKSYEETVGNFVVHHKWMMLALSLLVFFASASGLRFLEFSNDGRMFFSEENPQLQALEALEQTYTKVENVLFVIAPTSGNVFEKNTLTALAELTEEAWKIPYSRRGEAARAAFFRPPRLSCRDPDRGRGGRRF